MSEWDDYKVVIEDMEPRSISKPQLIMIINEKISTQWTHRTRASTIEIDVQPEWKKILREDGSILWDYHKLGWKAMHYQKKEQNGSVNRDWLSFKFLNYKGKKK